ncbi:MAG: RHS repeat protein, partial [bacterium]|nr:RHS repeat protein [bacterium]
MYSAATPSSPAQATVIHYPHGQTSGALAQQRYRYDGLGRLASQGRLLADGTWNQRLTTYDAMGRTRTLSEWQLAGTSGSDLRQTFATYDLLGRQTSVTAADGSLTTFTYGGLGHVDRQQSVHGTNVQVHQVFDRQGRLWKVAEPSGSVNGSPADVETTYSYDAGGRLRQVLINDELSPPYTQQIRRFEHDNRGFLVREVHPENGEVLYDDYDARGHAQRIVTGGTLLGPFDLSYTFDGAERLIRVERSSGRVLKEYVYGTTNGIHDGKTSWDAGRLVQATAYNHWDDTATNMEIIQIHHHAGPGGRLSHRTTELLDHVNAPVVFEQAFTWTELGQIESISYPDLVGSTLAP